MTAPIRAAILDSNNYVVNILMLTHITDIEGAISSDNASIGDHYDGISFSNGSATIDMVAYKAAKNLQINQWRLEANTTTFPYSGKLIACDDLSRSDIDGVANMISLTSALPAGFPGAWKATDNTYIPITSTADFIAMFSAMSAYGVSNFIHSQSLKTALAAAATKADVDAIAW